MIPRIEWDRFRNGRSPFRRPPPHDPIEHRPTDDIRPLRITFHAQGLRRLPPEEQAAVDLLRELTHLEEIEGYETQPGDLIHVELGDYDAAGDQRLVWVRREGDVVSLAGVGGMIDDLLLARAHIAGHSHIFVTGSKLLLDHRNDSSMASANRARRARPLRSRDCSSELEILMSAACGRAVG